MSTPPAVLRVHAEDTEIQHWDDRDAHGAVGFRTLVDADHGPSRALVQGIAVFGPGDTEAAHHHDRAETAFVLDGGGTLVLGEDTMTARAGDMLFVPPGTVHGWQAGDDGMRFLYSFAADRFSDVAYHWQDG